MLWTKVNFEEYVKNNK